LAVLEPPTTRRKRGTPPARPHPRGWWGAGPSPLERWPGVTIEIPSVWVPLKGHRREWVEVDDAEPFQSWVSAEGRLLEEWHGDDGGRWQSPDGKYYFDRGEADRACDFFPTYLRHHIGEFAGQPFELMPYQALLMTRPIFGWKRALDGFRRFRKLFAFLPKGAGKSPWAAATGLYLMLCDNEPAAEVYALAADRNQARVVHTNAKVMVEDSPDLLERCTVLRDSISCEDTRSLYQVLSADASTKHGFRPHAAIFDELHAQRNRDLYEAIKKSMIKRRQPLLIDISHAGNDDEGICYEEYELAKRVLSGSVPDDTCLPVIFEAKPGEDWSDPELWARVNPGHGVTVKQDAIAGECLEAQAEPRKRNDFLRFHLNMWTSQATAWIPIEWWDACKRPALDDAELVTLDCAGGLDLAQKWDLACFALVFRRYLATAAAPAIQVVDKGEDGTVTTRDVSLNYELFIRPFFWIPENTMRQHEKEDGVPYSLWAEQGLVTATEGDVIDYTRIYDDIVTKIVPRYPRLKQGTIGYDPAFANDLATKLRDKGNLQTVEVLQNYKMLSEPSQVVEALLKGKRVHHDGHRVLRWCFENACVKTDEAGRIRPVKPKNRSKRVDGAVATIIGTKALSVMAPPVTPQLFFVGGAKR
jgi:phage terminase large subunit-like protein